MDSDCTGGDVLSDCTGGDVFFLGKRGKQRERKESRRSRGGRSEAVSLSKRMTPLLLVWALAWGV